MTMDILPALPEPHPLMASGAYEPARHPVLAYLGRLQSELSRENMRRRLHIVTRMLTHDTLNARHFPWHQLTYVMVLSVRATLMETHAPQTVTTTLAAVKAVRRECWRLGDMTAEEMARATDVPGVKGTRLPTGRALEASEWRQLLHSCQHDRRRTLGARDAALLGILLGLGLRTSEAVSLNLEDYDPAAGTVRVLHAKGNRQREMPVPPPVAEVWQAWIAIRGEWPGPLLCAVATHDQLQSRHLVSRAINYILRKRRAAAKVAYFTPHDMRRSFISSLLDVGVDISMAQTLAGHINISTPQLYDRRGEKSKREAINRLPFPT
jgi:integrase/recombinase XerD